MSQEDEVPVWKIVNFKKMVLLRRRSANGSQVYRREKLQWRTLPTTVIGEKSRIRSSKMRIDI